MNHHHLNDKSILITGVTGGLGSALVHEILEFYQPYLLIVSGRNEQTLQALVDDCYCYQQEQKQKQRKQQQHAGTVVTTTTTTTIIRSIVCHLDDPISVIHLGTEALKIVAELLVPAMIRKYSENNLVNTNTKQQQKHVGRIIWIGSVLGLVGVPQRTSYVASKFAVQGYCESLRSELMTSNIRVHSVNPGYICTNLSMGAYTGNGTPYNQMDEVIRKGANPKYVAKCILQNVLQKNQLDFTIVPTIIATLAIYARLFCPSLLRTILVNRYKKIIKEQQQNQQHQREKIH